MPSSEGDWEVLVHQFAVGDRVVQVLSGRLEHGLAGRHGATIMQVRLDELVALIRFDDDPESLEYEAFLEDLVHIPQSTSAEDMLRWLES